jgi:hypothetical protein
MTFGFVSRCGSQRTLAEPSSVYPLVRETAFAQGWPARW